MEEMQVDLYVESRKPMTNPENPWQLSNGYCTNWLNIRTRQKLAILVHDTVPLLVARSLLICFLGKCLHWWFGLLLQHNWQLLVLMCWSMQYQLLLFEVLKSGYLSQTQFAKPKYGVWIDFCFFSKIINVKPLSVWMLQLCPCCTSRHSL